MGAAGTAKAAQDAAEETLRVRSRGTIGEIGQLLDDDDPQWHTFGLSAPADASTPGIPTALTLTPGAAGVVYAGWARSRRSERFRVYKQVVGVDPDFVAVVTVTETMASLTGQPTGKTMKVRVTAANDAGESAPSTVVQEFATRLRQRGRHRW